MGRRELQQTVKNLKLELELAQIELRGLRKRENDMYEARYIMTSRGSVPNPLHNDNAEVCAEAYKLFLWNKRMGASSEVLPPVYKEPEGKTFVHQEECTHGVTFDLEAAKGLDAHEVRRRWPRGFGECPLGCGYSGIAYASYMHYLYGDW